ncbi:hypothetical protein D4R86_03160 [bacterium]|nr:MAG: hypothetical protein D4R86_03160 [bacterium]
MGILDKKVIDQIEGRKGIHRQQVKREIQKGLQWFVDNYEESKWDISEENCTHRNAIYFVKNLFWAFFLSQVM